MHDTANLVNRKSEMCASMADYLRTLRPPAFKQCTLNFYPEEFQEIVRQSIKRIPNKSHNSMFLKGGFGTGKTAALMLICEEFYIRAARLIGDRFDSAKDVHIGTRPMMWSMTHRELAKCVNEEFGFHGVPKLFDEPDDMAHAILNPRYCMLIDEWGLIPDEYDKKSIVNTCHIIDYRWTWRLPTYVATNMTNDELKANPYFARMSDRFNDSEWCTVYTLGGESNRK